MNGILCMLMLFGGFPGEENADFKMIVDATLYDEYICSEDIWFGLYETDSGYELRCVELQQVTFPPPLEDWERPSGDRVEITNEEERPLILVSSTKSVFTEGLVHSVPLEYQVLAGGIRVKTTFTGAVPPAYQALANCPSLILTTPELPEYNLFATKEGLFLSSSGVCQHISSTSPSNYRQTLLALVWAGDLDRDGAVDLIIDDIDDGYNYYDYNLYLSSEAGSESFVELVASFYDVFY